MEQEQALGAFAGALHPDLENFEDWPVLPDLAVQPPIDSTATTTMVSLPTVVTRDSSTCTEPSQLCLCGKSTNWLCACGFLKQWFRRPDVPVSEDTLLEVLKTVVSMLTCKICGELLHGNPRLTTCCHVLSACNTCLTRHLVSTTELRGRFDLVQHIRCMFCRANVRSNNYTIELRGSLQALFELARIRFTNEQGGTATATHGSPSSSVAEAVATVLNAQAEEPIVLDDDDDNNNNNDLHSHSSDGDGDGDGDYNVITLQTSDAAHATANMQRTLAALQDQIATMQSELVHLRSTVVPPVLQEDGNAGQE